MASCIHIESLLQSYIDDELSTSLRLMVEEHVASCDGCAAQLREARAVTALLFEALHEDRLREDLAAPVMAHLPEMEFPHESRYVAHRHVAREQQRAGRWMRSAARLIPVFAPVILMVMGALLWSTWPSHQFGGENTVGVITYREGEIKAGHVSHARQRATRVRDIVTDGATYATADGARLQLGLAGPSHVAVYENAFFEVRNARELALHRGSAFLDVARDVHQFRVHTPNGDIRVLGTSFHVQVNDAATEVTVVNGAVLVENEGNFARAKRGSQVLFQRGAPPVVRHNVDVGPYLSRARAISADTVAERYFLARISRENTLAPASAPKEQVFVVDTRRRPVGALVLSWVPDPFSSGHAGYDIYVSDSAMTPLFKAHVPPSVFQDKAQGDLRILAPTDSGVRDVSLLHITVIPDLNGGVIETSFTDISAIGVK